MEVADEDVGEPAVRTKGYAPASTGEAAKRVLDAGGFDAAIGRIKAIGNSVARTMGEIDITPETAEVELLVKFKGAAGVVFASAAAEAQMKVKLTWKPVPKPTVEASE
ncbi:CU044_2847 family protein [Roseibium polysiphoniae]|uniref:CU044_2847 family protein n=1 Tax=Roseibium polysiphoniae TaxID=2571221 RepID=UPI003297D220